MVKTNRKQQTNIFILGIERCYFEKVKKVQKRPFLLLTLMFSEIHK